MNFFRTTDTTDTTDTTIWKPGLNFFRTTDTTDTTIWKPGFRLLYMLYDIWLMGRKTILETRFSYVLFSDKTWVFDQSELAQVPIYVINGDVNHN